MSLKHLKDAGLISLLVATSLRRVILVSLSLGINWCVFTTSKVGWFYLPTNRFWLVLYVNRYIYIYTDYKNITYIQTNTSVSFTYKLRRHDDVSAWSAINGVLRAVFNIRMEQNVSWSSSCICFRGFSYGEKSSWQCKGVSYVSRTWQKNSIEKLKSIICPS